jgi:hypothetical protein
MGVSDEAGKAVVATVEAMKASPLAIALVIICIGFMFLNGWVLHEIGVLSQQRNAAEGEMITTLISNLRECSMKGAALDLDIPKKTGDIRNE